MELVTGFAGTAHIDPVDTAHVHAASFGPGAYLLDTQNKMAAELETANKLVIDKGDLMIQGHHFTVIEPEDVALQSGVSGQKRNALVCAKYNKDANTGVETGSWVVKYGDSTTGTPTDPTVTTGDILDGGALVHEEPVYRIEYDGITPSDPILLLDEFTNNAAFRDSIYQVEDVTVTMTNANGPIFAKRSGSEVKLYIAGAQLKTQLNAWSPREVASIPAELAPKKAVLSTLTTDNGVAAFQVKTDGKITIEARSASLKQGLSMYGYVSWFVE